MGFRGVMLASLGAWVTALREQRGWAVSVLVGSILVAGAFGVFLAVRGCGRGDLTAVPLEQAQRQKKGLEETIVQMRQDKKALDDTVRKKEADIESLVSANARLREENKSLMQELETLKKQAERLQELAQSVKTSPAKAEPPAAEQDEPAISGSPSALSDFLEGLRKALERSETPESTSGEERADKVGAWVAAQEFVKQELLSPSSASFGWQSTNECVTYLGDGKYSVSGYVDAQNAFGATIRNRFQCTLEHLGGSSWTCLSISLTPR